MIVATGGMKLSDAFREYAALLLRLHEMIAAGTDETLAGDELRDAMDAPWHGMTDAERALVDGLSTDLYSLGTTSYADTSAHPTEQLASIVSSANWRDLLQFLRDHAGQFPPQVVAHLRGLSWSELGCDALALLFFRESSRLSVGTLQNEYAFLGSVTFGTNVAGETVGS